MQRRTAQAIGEGHNVIVTAETGSGKTLAFLMPTLARLTYPTGGDEEMQACQLVYTVSVECSTAFAVSCGTRSANTIMLDAPSC